MGFRSDIEGLRAIAVGMIVLYHAGVTGLSGGFVGVDVFFVISGFLITSILVRDIESGGFSFKDFYLRRLRRLGPALIVTLLVTLAAAWFVLSPTAYDGAAQSALAAALSVSNILFYLEAGYFDAASIEKPFLHTWSLAVEEQFYLIWPALLLLLLPRAGRRGLVVVMVLGGALSVLATEWMLNRDPTAAFFLLPFRLAEFGFGTVLAVYGRNLSRGLASDILAGGGLLLIVASALLFSEGMRFPGVSALVPSLGCALVIRANPGSRVNQALGVAPCRYIGRISYSLYLVHWPIVVLYSYVQGSPDSLLEVAGLVAASVLAADLLYRFVETPFRTKGSDGQLRVSTRRLCQTTGLGALGLAGACVAIIALSGVPSRLPPDIRALEAEIRDGRSARELAARLDSCHFSHLTDDSYAQVFDTCNAMAPGAVVVFGDSHAADVYVALSRLYPDAPVIQLTGAGCGLSRMSMKGPSRRCGAFFEFAERWLSDNALDLAHVLYVQRGGHILEEEGEGVFYPAPAREAELLAALERLVPADVPLTVVGPRAEFHPQVDIAVARAFSADALAARMEASDMSAFQTLDTRLAAQTSKRGWSYLSLYDVLCAEACQYKIDTGELLVVDYGHWTPVGGTQVMSDALKARPDLAAHLDRVSAVLPAN